MKKNKFIKRILLLVVFIMLSITGQAQSADEIKRPSENAQQFTAIASTNVGLHTGQMSVNIPLFTLQGNGADIPVSLAFSGAEITHQSEASPVGLGWSLLAGGVISVTIRGKEDTQTTSRAKIPWQYDRDYLTGKRDEQAQNPYPSDNKVDAAMNLILSEDYAPDSYKYTFQGHSGDIIFEFDDNDNLQGKLYPDKTFKINRTAGGFRIITGDGVQYYFECKEYNYANDINAVTSYFLSEIKTPQGGHVTFTYMDETSYDLRQELQPGSSSSTYPMLKKKRLTRIDSEFGYALLDAPRPNVDHVPNPLQILGIELHDKQGTLIKGYELNSSTSYFTNDNKVLTSSYNTRLRLDNVIEYDRNGNFLPGYYFKYDYYFARAKNSYKHCQAEGDNCSRATWAICPGWLALVDRNVYGQPACWVEAPDTPYMRVRGYNTLYENCDDTVHDYFCLTQITFPTGKSEAYTYERHDYSHVSSNPEVVQPPTAVIGRRLLRKTISDTDGKLRYVDYKYKIHDANYAIPKSAQSSGVLVTPSIHTSVAYKPVTETGHQRFVAMACNTHKPQNCLNGPVVCYTEVEEIYSSPSGTLGRKIYYFDKIIAAPAVNYVYTNYNYDTGERGNVLVPIPNTLYGTLKRYPPAISAHDNLNMTHIAYPVGEFNYPVRTVGKVMKELTLDSIGTVVRKVVNEYNIGTSRDLYGFLVRKYVDSPASSSFKANRYLISQTTHNAVYSSPKKRTVTDYILTPGSSAKDSITEVYTWTYSGLRLFSTSRELGNGESVTTENTYPDQIRFDVNTGLSAQASALKSMVELNMIDFPIQTVKKKGNKYIEGTYSTYKPVNSTCFVTDSVFCLESEPGGSTALIPYVNTKGQLVRHGKFAWEQVFAVYDENVKPASVVYRNKPSTYFRWGHGGRYVIARIDNYTSKRANMHVVLNRHLSTLAGCKGASDDLYNCNKGIRENVPANVLVTTYTYDPMVGMTSETGPSGNARYYDYDGFGRLNRVRDYSNCTVEDIEYNLAY